MHVRLVEERRSQSGCVSVYVFKGELGARMGDMDEVEQAVNVRMSGVRVGVQERGVILGAGGLRWLTEP